MDTTIPTSCNYLHSIMVQVYVYNLSLDAFMFCIYIPLWFKSMDNQQAMQELNKQIYIPLWFKSMLTESINESYSRKIYIPLWFKSMLVACLPP